VRAVGIGLGPLDITPWDFPLPDRKMETHSGVYPSWSFAKR
jgi:hypothetical protein